MTTTPTTEELNAGFRDLIDRIEANTRRLRDLLHQLQQLPISTTAAGAPAATE